MTKVTEFVNRYTFQIGGVIIFILVMWLGTMFVSIDTFDEYKDAQKLEWTMHINKQDADEKEHDGKYTNLRDRIGHLEHIATQLENDMNTGSRRLQTYITKIKELTKELDEIENQQIRHDEKIKWLEKK